MDTTEGRNREGLASILPPDISKEDASNALLRVCGSPGFATNERLRLLLQFIVKETLEGRGDRIKAYTIATAILNRPASFDPQKDSIVRIEATRLRRELEHYYLGPGRNDRIIISIPKGAYVASFSMAGQPDGQPAPAAESPPHERSLSGPSFRAGLSMLVVLVLAAATYWIIQGRDAGPAGAVRLPALVVQPLTDLTGTEETRRMASGLSESLIDKLSRFRELTVIAADPSSPPSPLAVAGYELSGTFRYGPQGIVVQARLVERRNRAVLWADEYKIETQPERLAEVEEQVANKVAASVAEPNGVVFEAERKSELADSGQNWSESLCILNAYAYRVSLPAAQRAAVRLCLEKAVAALPGHSTSWALLSLVYLDELRFPYQGPRSGKKDVILGKAYEAARKAVELDPNNMRAQQALMMALFFRQDFQAAIDVGSRALRLNPNDLELKGEFGFRRALHGDWADGCALIQQTLEESLRRRPYYETALAICRYFAGDLRESVRLIEDADASANPVYHVWASVIHSASGKVAEAASHREWLKENASESLPVIIADLPGRLFRKQDQEKIRAGLKSAGFSVATAEAASP